MSMMNLLPLDRYAEHLVAALYDLKLEANGHIGFDGRDPQGNRYEVRSRKPPQVWRKTPTRRSVETHGDYDFLVAVYFELDRSIVLAVRMVAAIAQAHHSLSLFPKILEMPGVEDITEALRRVAASKEQG